MLGKFRRLLSDIGWPVAVIVALLLLWEGTVRYLGIQSIILPTPSAIAEVFFARFDVLLSNLWPSLYLTLLGFLLSVTGGVAVAVLITYSNVARRGIYPVIVISQIIPKIAIAPLFIVWFGAGTVSALLLAFLVAFFPMTINAAMGFATIDGDIHRMARSFMGSRWHIFWKIRMPAALPSIFAGMKISITLAIIGVIVSEFVASQQGMGYLIKLAGGLLDTPLMMATIVMLSIAGLVLYGIIALLETVTIRWQTPSDPAPHSGS